MSVPLIGPASRRRQCIDADWRFTRDEQDGSVAVAWSAEEQALLGFDPDPHDIDGITWSKSGKCYGPASPEHDDDAWRPVNLPHDWSVESEPSPEHPVRNGFLPMGIGWYRKTLIIPEEWAGSVVSLQFDGVYRKASVLLVHHLFCKSTGEMLGEASVASLPQHLTAIAA